MEYFFKKSDNKNFTFGDNILPSNHKVGLNIKQAFYVQAANTNANFLDKVVKSITNLYNLSLISWQTQIFLKQAIDANNLDIALSTSILIAESNKVPVNVSGANLEIVVKAELEEKFYPSWFNVFARAGINLTTKPNVKLNELVNLPSLLNQYIYQKTPNVLLKRVLNTELKSYADNTISALATKACNAMEPLFTSCKYISAEIALGYVTCLYNIESYWPKPRFTLVFSVGAKFENEQQMILNSKSKQTQEVATKIANDQYLKFNYEALSHITEISEITPKLKSVKATFETIYLEPSNPINQFLDIIIKKQYQQPNQNKDLSHLQDFILIFLNKNHLNDPVNLLAKTPEEINTPCTNSRGTFIYKSLMQEVQNDITTSFDDKTKKGFLASHSFGKIIHKCLDLKIKCGMAPEYMETFYSSGKKSAFETIDIIKTLKVNSEYDGGLYMGEITVRIMSSAGIVSLLKEFQGLYNKCINKCITNNLFNENMQQNNNLIELANLAINGILYIDSYKQLMGAYIFHAKGNNIVNKLQKEADIWISHRINGKIEQQRFEHQMKQSHENEERLAILRKQQMAGGADDGAKTEETPRVQPKFDQTNVSSPFAKKTRGFSTSTFNMQRRNVTTHQSSTAENKVADRALLYINLEDLYPALWAITHNKTTMKYGSTTNELSELIRREKKKIALYSGVALKEQTKQNLKILQNNELTNKLLIENLSCCQVLANLTDGDEMTIVTHDYVQLMVQRIKQQIVNICSEFNPKVTPSATNQPLTAESALIVSTLATTPLISVNISGYLLDLKISLLSNKSITSSTSVSDVVKGFSTEIIFSLCPTIFIDFFSSFSLKTQVPWFTYVFGF